MPELSLAFGNDQKAGVDELLEQQVKEKKVLSFTSEPFTDDRVLYKIQFKEIYDIYKFGHDQAHMFKRIFKLQN